MKQDRFIMFLLIIFLALCAAVGMAIVFKPAQQKKASEATAREGSEKIGKLFAGLSARKEGIAVVKIYGPIQTESSESLLGFYESGADLIVKKIKRARENKLVKAVVIRVNSPGGTVAASQEILDEIKKTRKEGKKVVVSMGDLAASGGYYISCHADRIFADQGTITGSIGVFVGGLNLTELAKKIGVDMTVIKSGKFKDILSPWRPMTDEEKQLLQETVNDVYGQFLEEVSTGRGIPMDQVVAIADGRILTGRQARNLKLVDEIGGLQDAVAAAAKLAGLKGKPEIVKDYEDLWDDMFDMFESSMDRRAGVLDFIRPSRSTLDAIPVTYLYSPAGE
jgi:protease-4